MNNLIVLAVIVLAAWAMRRSQRRRGTLDVAPLLRIVGIAGAVLYIVFEGSHFLINYAWWRELGQKQTYWQYLRIRWLPQTLAALVAMAVLVVVFRIARRRVGTPLAGTRLFGLIGQVGAALLGLFLSSNIVNPWTIALYLGAVSTPGYRDPLFGHDLAFYLFRLPFFQMAFAWIAALVVAGLIIFGATLALGSSAERMQEFRERVVANSGWSPGPRPVTPLHAKRPAMVGLGGLLRAAAVLLLLIFAVSQFFARYGLLYAQHNFLYGADFVDARWGLPLLWVQMAGALLLALLVLLARPPRDSGRFGPFWLGPAVIAGFILLLIAPAAIQGLVRSVYVSANELSLERPYIADHIQATRMAYGLAQQVKERAFTPAQISSLDLSQFPRTEENLRLWNGAPFLENITQLQALRPYYSFPSVAVDRYRINGHKRQILIAARGLDTSHLPANAQTWQNLALEYTHGYGAVAALVNGATAQGQPELVLQDAPPVASVPRLQISQPGIYFGEDTTNAVFVKTATPNGEFDYPKGEDNAYTAYQGRAGIALGKPWMRWAAAIDRDDSNLIFSDYITPQTRLLLHRQILARVHRLAPFLRLAPDPYLVIDRRGRLFWMVDAFTTSDQHPYSEPVTLPSGREINYIRNSVKITVDAYNGTVHFYVFDPNDPVLAAYRRVFPSLFEPRTAMPADLLRHIRYPSELFEIQAQVDRLYHMKDPQVFYNKEDQWDVAMQLVAQGQTAPTNPYYVMVRLPGEKKAEFVLMLPFTSHGKNNMIAWLAARCDPQHYGQIVFYRLPKEQLVYGPLQIQSMVDQNRAISKDLSLWNQQGSKVIRGATLVLPVGGTFLYLEPIYIQATQAPMPELKKVVLALGDRLVYADDLPSAIAELAQPVSAGGSAATVAPAVASGAGAQPGPALAMSAAALRQLRAHLEAYRKDTAAGDFAAAGKELQAMEQELDRALRP